MASLPVLETHNTFCALTGLAEINSTIAKSELYNRMNFLMTCSLSDRGDGIGLLQRCGAGETSVGTVGAHVVVAEGNNRTRVGIYSRAVATHRRCARVNDRARR